MKTNKKCFMKCLSKIWTILLVHWVLIEKVDAEPLQIISQTVSAMDENQAEPVTFFFGFANQFRFELTKPAEMEIRFTALPGKNWSKNVNNSRNRRCNEVVLNAFWRAKGLNESPDNIFGVSVGGTISYCGGGGGGGGRTDQFTYELDSEREIKIEPDVTYAGVNEEVPLKAVRADGSDSVVLATWEHNGGNNAVLNPATGTSPTATFSASRSGAYVVTAKSLYDTHTAQADVNIMEVVIKDENGEFFPNPYIGVNQSVTYTAVVDPSASGVYEWSATNSSLIELTSDQNKLTVTAKQNPSTEIGDVELKVVFRPDGGSRAFEATHKLTVVLLDVIAQPMDRTPDLPPGLICLNAQDEYKYAEWKAIIKPAGLYGEVTSSAEISILNLEQEPLIVADGTPFDIIGNSKGHYELSIKLQEDTSIEAKGESTVFNLVLQTTDATYQSSTTGEGQVENNTTISFEANSAMRHAADVETRRFSGFITDPVNSYSGYVSARLNAVQLFRSGIQVLNLPHENAVGGVYVFADSLAAEKITIDLSFGIVSVPPISLVNSPQKAFAAWKGELKIQGPNDPEPFTSPTTQAEAKSSNINWLVGGWDWKNINTQSSVGTHINHYEVGNPMSRAVVHTRHSCSGTRTRNSFEAKSNAFLPVSEHTPLVTIDLQTGLKLVATETP